LKRGETVIEFKDFSFQYLAQMEPTLYDINLTIRKGEKILIAGPSGCGKSTVVNCINGLIPFSYKGEMKGSLKVGGLETKDQSISQISNMVGTVLQDSDAQFIGMTVLEDIAFALENEGIVKEEMVGRVKKAAEIVDISDHLSYAPTDLSGGQIQRTLLARALASEPEVLLLDEPTAFLDPRARRNLINVLKSLPHTMMIATHDLAFAAEVCSRSVILREGKLFADGPSSELLNDDEKMEAAGVESIRRYYGIG